MIVNMKMMIHTTHNQDEDDVIETLKRGNSTDVGRLIGTAAEILEVEAELCINIALKIYPQHSKLSIERVREILSSMHCVPSVQFEDVSNHTTLGEDIERLNKCIALDSVKVAG